MHKAPIEQEMQKHRQRIYNLVNTGLVYLAVEASILPIMDNLQ